MANPENPDFSLASKNRIAKVVREVEGYGDSNKNHKRPAFPRGGGSFLPPAQYQGMGLFCAVDGKWGAAFPPAVESLL
jgi:hypothetical protein